MTWLAPIVGYSDNLGRLRCTNCAEDHQRQFSVSGEQWFSTDDVCERCHWRFKHIRSVDYVQVEPWSSAPDLIRGATSRVPFRTQQPPVEDLTMARKKEAPKPLLALKHDFYDSLDNVIQQSIRLISAVEFAVEHGDLPAAVRSELDKQVKEFRASVFNED